MSARRRHVRLLLRTAVCSAHCGEVTFSPDFCYSHCGSITRPLIYLVSLPLTRSLPLSVVAVAGAGAATGTAALGGRAPFKSAGDKANAAKAAELLQKAVEQVIKAICTADKEQWFLNPVTEQVAPGYFSVIKHPMDVVTMKKVWREGGSGCDDGSLV